MYQPKTYRHWVRDTGLVSFNVNVKETDLYIRAWRNLRRRTLKTVLKCRASIEGYIGRYPSFLTTLEPFPVQEDAPRIIREMSRAAGAVSVGPMAAVAGAIAECVGKELLSFSPEVIVENGGDIFLKVTEKRSVGIYAGESPLSGKVALEIEPEETPLGICTSSGTVGHSLSFGRVDAVVALAPSTSLADAAATAIGNLVREATDIAKGIEFAQRVDGLRGVVIIKYDKMGVWGAVRIAPAQEEYVCGDSLH
ncbi:UPF0280 family protein [Dehalococcoidia bacterium]|nr:UPF0280 family protein [Dehalococcoidia bacterium]